MNAKSRITTSVASLALLLGCANEPDRRIAGALSADHAANFSAWSQPVNLGSPINTVGFNDRVVSELSDASANDAAASVRTDGREIFFGSSRSHGAGGLDVWFSVRRSVHDPWSPPEPLAALNSGASDQQPSLSSDGRTLFFASDRSGLGGTDIWMSTRTPSGH